MKSVQEDDRLWVRARSATVPVSDPNTQPRQTSFPDTRPGLDARPSIEARPGIEARPATKPNPVVRPGPALRPNLAAGGT